MRARPLALALLVPLAACVSGGGTSPARHAPVALRPPPVPGNVTVMGLDAPALTAVLGTPALDVREGPARKLQFRGPACVLDAYLYPPAGAAAGAAAAVRWVDTRTPAGGDIDRASCIAALRKR